MAAPIVVEGEELSDDSGGLEEPADGSVLHTSSDTLSVEQSSVSCPSTPSTSTTVRHSSCISH